MGTNEEIRPNYYQSSNGIECKDAIEAATEHLTGIEAFYTGSIIKYAWRWKKKNGIEDLNKVATYANLLIRWLEEHENA